VFLAECIKRPGKVGTAGGSWGFTQSYHVLSPWRTTKGEDHEDYHRAALNTTGVTGVSSGPGFLAPNTPESIDQQFRRRRRAGRFIARLILAAC